MCTDYWPPLTFEPLEFKLHPFFLLQSNSTFQVKLDEAVSALCACLRLLAQPVRGGSIGGGGRDYKLRDTQCGGYIPNYIIIMKEEIKIRKYTGKALRHVTQSILHACTHAYRIRTILGLCPAQPRIRRQSYECGRRYIGKCASSERGVRLTASLIMHENSLRRRGLGKGLRQVLEQGVGDRLR